MVNLLFNVQIDISTRHVFYPWQPTSFKVSVIYDIKVHWCITTAPSFF